MNRHARRAHEVDQRRAAQRRGDLIALAHQVISDMADRDETVAGATLILPDGEVTYVDAATIRRGGSA
jgi:hypothetical protein